MTRLLIFLLAAMLIASPAIGKDQKERSLPPGLQKKSVATNYPLGGKKLIVGDFLPDDIYGRGKIVVPLDDKGLITVRIEGVLVRLYQETREIIEILNTDN